MRFFDFDRKTSVFLREGCFLSTFKLNYDKLIENDVSNIDVKYSLQNLIVYFPMSSSRVWRRMGVGNLKFWDNKTFVVLDIVQH